MDDEIAVVHENPFGVIVPLETNRPFAARFQALSDAVADRLNLALVRAAAENEVVGERGDLAKVQNANVGSLFRFSGAYCGQPEWDFVRDFGQERPPLSS
jgi:hypothetical protein